MARPYKDITGKICNKLTAIKFIRTDKVQWSDGRDRSCAVWLWKCQCGNEIEAQARYVERGFKKSCGCHVRRGEQSVAYHVYYKYVADGGNLQFDDFYRLSQMPCHYCGAELSNCAKRKGNEFKYNGLNRLDNSRGHDLDNVVPCCWPCNERISDTNHDQIVSWVKQVYERICLNGNTSTDYHTSPHP